VTIRVAVWGPGSMGVIALRGVIDHPELELVDLVVHSDVKAGRDAGELCGADPVGVVATTDPAALLGGDADVVVYAAAANLRPLARVGQSRQQELDRILSNLNVIMQALADEQDQLGHIVDSGDTVMSAIASRDQALAGTVRNGASVFGSLDQAFSGVTAADRASLQKSPPTIAAGRRTLALTNPQVDQLLPELLLGQISYPNDQLNISNDESLILAREWIAGFAQQCDVPPTNCLRIFGGFQVGNTVTPPGGSAGPLPAAPPDLTSLLMQALKGTK